MTRGARAKAAVAALLAGTARYARRARRTYRRRAGTLLLLMIAIASVIAVAPKGGRAGAPGLQSIMAMLAMRSPGERVDGNLVNTKPARAAPTQRALAKTFVPGAPQERALGKVFDPADFAPPLETAAAGLPALQPDLPGIAPAGLTSGPAPDGGIGDDLSPSGSGGGTPGGGTPGGETPGSPVPAVPEPATWLMMIVAFGLCGTMLRRARRIEARRDACTAAS